jgi:hypothetical protein
MTAKTSPRSKEETSDEVEREAECRQKSQELAEMLMVRWCGCHFGNPGRDTRLER